MDRIVAEDGVRVDALCPGKNRYRVLHTDGVVWSVELEAGGAYTAAKFYILQLLVSHASPPSYALWARWGRVPSDGAHSLRDRANRDDAVFGFMSKFLSKTANPWLSPAGFRPRDGKWTVFPGGRTWPPAVVWAGAGQGPGPT